MGLDRYDSIATMIGFVVLSIGIIYVILRTSRQNKEAEAAKAAEEAAKKRGAA